MGAVDELVYLLDEAFRGKGIEETNESQSLLANLGSVDDRIWRTPPPGGKRTIESVVLHVGSCKVMYEEYAFGPGRLNWDDAAVQPWPEGAAPREESIAWLTRAHDRFVDRVRALNDDDLACLRPANWGEDRETRWLISTILQHDTYHAGEINHIRALLLADDAWRWG
jgi:DinB superfamily